MTSSPEASKRAFLEKKGLTTAEIEEAFRRAPQQATTQPTDPPTQPVGSSPAFPATAPAATTPTTAGGGSGPPHPHGATTATAITAPQTTGLRWTQVVVRMGLLAAAGSYAYKAMGFGGGDGGRRGGTGGGTSSAHLSSATESATAAADAAAHALNETRATMAAEAKALTEARATMAEEVKAAAEARRAAEAQTAEVARSMTHHVESLLSAAKKESGPADVADAVSRQMDALRDELKGVVAAAVADAVGTSPSAGDRATPGMSAAVSPMGMMPESVREELAQIKAMLYASPFRPRGGEGDDVGSESARSTPATATPASGAGRSRRSLLGGYGASDASASAGGVDGQSGKEAAANGEAGDIVVPPPPDRTPAMASSSTAATPVRQSNGVGDGGEGEDPSGEPPHPASYMEVLEMLKKGQTPPGIRDIDDAPPDPNAELPAATLPRKPKPWEAAALGEASSRVAAKPWQRQLYPGSGPSGSGGIGEGSPGRFSVEPAGGPSTSTEGGATNPFSDVSAAKGKGAGAGGSAAATPSPGGGEGKPAWRPPSVPTMSTEASKVLMSRHALGIPGTSTAGGYGGGWSPSTTPTTDKGGDGVGVDVA